MLYDNGRGTHPRPVATGSTRASSHQNAMPKEHRAARTPPARTATESTPPQFPSRVR